MVNDFYTDTFEMENQVHGFSNLENRSKATALKNTGFFLLLSGRRIKYEEQFL